MRRLARTGLALVGLALAAPISVWADPPAASDLPSASASSPGYAATGGSPMFAPNGAPDTGPGSPLTLAPSSPTDTMPASPAQMPQSGLASMPSMGSSTASSTYQPPRSSRARASAKKSPKHRWSLFRGRCQCPDCQRAAVLARDGVQVPPPPAVPTMMASGGTVAERCEVCEAQGGQVVMQGPVNAGSMPGRAVVGGPAPGYAVVGESAPTSEPMPVGVVGARLAGVQPMPTAAAPRDSMLTPSSMSPNPVPGHGHNRPHILSHVFFLDSFGKRSKIARERAKDEHHAAIPYGPQAEEKVTELPASMVYGRRGRN